VRAEHALEEADPVDGAAGGRAARPRPRRPDDLVGDPPPDQAPIDVSLERMETILLSALEPMQRRETPDQGLTLARHACKVPDDHPEGRVFATIKDLVGLYEKHAG
jgi:hypothetical protein